MSLTITKASLGVVHAHAVDTYPDECCGMIIDRNGHEEVIRVTNLQNELHAKDPEQFPRTARIAYTMGPEAAPVLIGSERGEVQLRAFYHSHPEHDAYFSAEDRKQALGGWDEPSYPHAAQIVVSVRERTVRATKVFAWDPAVRDFTEVPLIVDPNEGPPAGSFPRAGEGQDEGD
ncbi:MAG: Mov34/MPN/PAD-1 family protein [Candidatus Binatia bacterium]